MKMQGQHLLKEISKEHMKDLTKDVQETVASEYHGSQEKIFSTADLWNIRRRRKQTNQRRNLV